MPKKKKPTEKKLIKPTEKKQTINGSMTPATEVIGERETMECFVEGAKKAASAARELAKELANPSWDETAAMLEAIGRNGMKLSKMRSMNRLETAMAMRLKTGSKNLIV